MLFSSSLLDDWSVLSVWGCSSVVSDGVSSWTGCSGSDGASSCTGSSWGSGVGSWDWDLAISAALCGVGYHLIKRYIPAAITAIAPNI